ALVGGWVGLGLGWVVWSRRGGEIGRGALAGCGSTRLTMNGGALEAVGVRKTPHRIPAITPEAASPPGEAKNPRRSEGTGAEEQREEAGEEGERGEGREVSGGKVRAERSEE
ncbi:MAG: hypothetical protein OXN91_07480, partial [Chloroflexota bacterium]|nr:hypothetical protein [Chloroflexota bacterium]